MELYIVDGTYELFRSHFGYPSRISPDGTQVGALKGYITHLNSLKKQYRYLCVAFDSEVESFRNELYDGYKSSNDMDPDILNQFPLAEEVTKLLGITLLSMKKYEADDGIASVCEQFVGKNIKIIIGSLDKDLMQCVKGDEVVMYSTRYKTFTNNVGVKEKFGILPNQIPDYLALTGDSSDGIPGMKGIGQKTATLLLQRYENIDLILNDVDNWKKTIRGGETHAETISNNFELLTLFKELTTLKKFVNVPKDIEDYKIRDINQTKLNKFSEKYRLNI